MIVQRTGTLHSSTHLPLTRGRQSSIHKHVNFPINGSRLSHMSLLPPPPDAPALSSLRRAMASLWAAAHLARGVFSLETRKSRGLLREALEAWSVAAGERGARERRLKRHGGRAGREKARRVLASWAGAALEGWRRSSEHRRGADARTIRHMWRLWASLSAREGFVRGQEDANRAFRAWKEVVRVMAVAQVNQSTFVSSGIWGLGRIPPLRWFWLLLD
jgi:hypothetical protein